MSRLWMRIVTRHAIVQQDTEPCAWATSSEAMTELCRRLDVPRPLWLPKHTHEYDQFHRTAFTADHFIEAISFDRMEIEYLDDNDKPRKSRDPRNAF